MKGKQGTFPIENERGSDHSIVRQGLKQIVSECPGMVVAGEAASGQEVLDLVRKRNFDVAIVDIAMPGRGGLEILRELKAEKPSMKLMVLSMYSEEQYAIRSLRDGASAYLTKASAPDDLVQAIQAVAKGKRYITPSVAEKMVTYIEVDSERPRHERLSDRDLQVLVLLGGGKSVSDIAGELSLSVKTIAQLIKYAVQFDLVQ